MEDRDQEIVKMRMDLKTMKEISVAFGITRQRVQQILKQRGYSGRISASQPKQYKLSKIERFWMCVDKSKDCWEWKKSRLPTGYGHLKWEGRQMYTHRVAWILERGPIPPGLLVCHKCDNPSCCNPDHLFLGTHKDNTHDRDAKGRSGSHLRIKTHCKRGHEFTKENTAISSGRRYCKACRRYRYEQYKIAKTHIDVRRHLDY